MPVLDVQEERPGPAERQQNPPFEDVLRWKYNSIVAYVPEKKQPRLPGTRLAPMNKPSGYNGRKDTTNRHAQPLPGYFQKTADIKNRNDEKKTRELRTES